MKIFYVTTLERDTLNGVSNKSKKILCILIWNQIEWIRNLFYKNYLIEKKLGLLNMSFFFSICFQSHFKSLSCGLE